MPQSAWPPTRWESSQPTLTASGYRSFRGHPARATALPSELTISLLFGGWHRAVEHAESRAESTDVEDDVRGRLYGDRARTPRR